MSRRKRRKHHDSRRNMPRGHFYRENIEPRPSEEFIPKFSKSDILFVVSIFSFWAIVGGLLFTSYKPAKRQIIIQQNLTKNSTSNDRKAALEIPAAIQNAITQDEISDDKLETVADNEESIDAATEDEIVENEDGNAETMARSDSDKMKIKYAQPEKDLFPISKEDKTVIVTPPSDKITITHSPFSEEHGTEEAEDPATDEAIVPEP